MLYPLEGYGGAVDDKNVYWSKQLLEKSAYFIFGSQLVCWMVLIEEKIAKKLEKGEKMS